MRKIIFLLILIMSAGIIASSCGNSPEMTEVKIYFTDAQMFKLVPVVTYIPDSTPQKKAQTVINELIEGKDGNRSIYRTIPKIKKGMSVKVKDKTAHVNITKPMIEAHQQSRDAEILTVYSIVNSLTGIDGITTVKFTIDGKTVKDFMGYIDMRETFIPDYMI